MQHHAIEYMNRRNAVVQFTAISFLPSARVARLHPSLPPTTELDYCVYIHTEIPFKSVPAETALGNRVGPLARATDKSEVYFTKKNLIRIARAQRYK